LLVDYDARKNYPLVSRWAIAWFRTTTQSQGRYRRAWICWKNAFASAFCRKLYHYEARSPTAARYIRCHSHNWAICKLKQAGIWQSRIDSNLDCSSPANYPRSNKCVIVRVD
jgi:hypothetical protein